jgi:hypothetical protein
MRYRSSAFVTVCSTVFLVQLSVAIVTVFVDEARQKQQQLFLFGLVWTGQTLAVITLLPFHTFFANVRSVLLGLGTLAHSALLLGVQSGGTKSPYFYLLLLLFCSIILATGLRNTRCMRSVLVATPEQEAKAAYLANNPQASDAEAKRAAAMQVAVAEGDVAAADGHSGAAGAKALGLSAQLVEVELATVLPINGRARSSSDDHALDVDDSAAGAVVPVPDNTAANEVENGHDEAKWGGATESVAPHAVSADSNALAEPSQQHPRSPSLELDPSDPQLELVEASPSIGEPVQDAPLMPQQQHSSSEDDDGAAAESDPPVPEAAAPLPPELHFPAPPERSVPAPRSGPSAAAADANDGCDAAEDDEDDEKQWKRRSTRVGFF